MACFQYRFNMLLRSSMGAIWWDIFRGIFFPLIYLYTDSNSYENIWFFFIENKLSLNVFKTHNAVFTFIFSYRAHNIPHSSPASMLFNFPKRKPCKCQICIRQHYNSQGTYIVESFGISYKIILHCGVIWHIL